MEPINYILDVKNPIDEYMKGLKFARTDLADQQAMQINQQNMSMAQQQFADQQRALQEQRAAADKAVADARAGQAELARLAGLGAAATAEDYMKAWVANPAIRDDLNNLKTMITEPQSAALLQTTQNMYATTASGNIEATRNILQTQLDAAMNSGDQQMVPAYRAALDQLDQDPEGAMAQLKTTSAMTLMGLKGPEYIKTINESLGLTPQKPAEAVSPIGKIAADVKAGLIPKSVLDAAIKVEAVNAEGGLTLKDKVAEEARLRGEYSKRTEDLTSAERNQSIIETSAADNTGAGDIALVTSFMKMLDPGSVVRETEFATAANAGGLLGRLQSLATKVESGQFLSAEQRTEFQNLSRKFLEAARMQEQGVQQSYQAIVDNYGLNPVNVFGARAATEGASGAIPQSFLSSQAVIDAATKNGTTPEAMWGIMSAEQRALYGE
jgi:hypothetical protein